MMNLARVHCAYSLCGNRFVVDGGAAPRGFGLFLLPSVNATESPVIVMAQPLEEIEHGHLKVRARKRRRKFPANRVQNTNAGLLFDTLGQEFLGSSRTF